MKIPKCVCCGYCCTVSACIYGAWDYNKKQCHFLTPEMKCSKYDEIKIKDDIIFECGCSSSLFNEVREKKIKDLNLSKDDCFIESA